MAWSRATRPWVVTAGCVSIHPSKSAQPACAALCPSQTLLTAWHRHNRTSADCPTVRRSPKGESQLSLSAEWDDDHSGHTVGAKITKLKPGLRLCRQTVVGLQCTSSPSRMQQGRSPKTCVTMQCGRERMVPAFSKCMKRKWSCSCMPLQFASYAGS